MLSKEENFIFNAQQDFYLLKLEEQKSFFARFFKDEKKESKPEEIREKTIVTRPPQVGCRAFITDLVVSDEYWESNISEIYKLDAYSDYVGAGKYDNCHTAFPNAARGTFDGLAVDKGTRIIIYSEPFFKGEILLDIVGPAIINNVLWKNDIRYNGTMTKKFKEPYEKMFPPKVRLWSKSDMRKWSNGSIIVCCNT